MRFLVSLVYQLTTVVLIAFFISAFFYFLPNKNWKGVLWSGFAIYVFAGLAVALYIHQHYFSVPNSPPPNKKETPSMPTKPEDNQQVPPSPITTPTPVSVSQTMNNSPGGIQVGRDFIINRDKRLIQSLVLHIVIQARTPPQAVSDPATDFGLQSVLALFTDNNARIRFVTDYKFTVQQVEPTLRQIQFTYQPESPQEILGREVDFLSAIQTLVVDYKYIFEVKQFGLNGEPMRLAFAVFLNGLEVGSLASPFEQTGLLAAGQTTYQVGHLFSQIPQLYNDKVSV